MQRYGITKGELERWRQVRGWMWLGWLGADGQGFRQRSSLSQLASTAPTYQSNTGPLLLYQKTNPTLEDTPTKPSPQHQPNPIHPNTRPPPTPTGHAP